MKRIGIIVGSNRPNRIGRHMAEWVQKHLQHDGFSTELIDLAEINLPFLDEPETADTQHYTQEHTRKWSELIQGYDGFVLVFPQYNWGYPAVLKNALDFLYYEWANKPVSMMCYGSHGGFQGALALSLVLRGLHMQTMATNPPLNIADDMFDEHGQFKDIDAAMAPSVPAVQLTAREFADIFGL